METPTGQVKEVQLSTGQKLRIGLLRWRRGWVPVKNLVLKSLQTPAIQGAVKRLVDAYLIEERDVEADTATLGRRFLDNLAGRSDLIDDVARLLPEALEVVSSNWDEITDHLIRGSVEPGQDISQDELNILLGELPLTDIVKLREAVLEINDLAEYVVIEGNSLVGVFSKLMIQESASNGTKTESSQGGGLTTNPSSSQPVTASGT